MKKKKKKHKPGSFVIKKTPHEGYFYFLWTLNVDWKKKKRLYIYIWTLISCLSRRMRFNPPRFSPGSIYQRMWKKKKTKTEQNKNKRKKK